MYTIFLEKSNNFWLKNYIRIDFKVYIFCQRKLSSFQERRREISFCMNELTVLELRVFVSNFGKLFEYSFYVLLSTFSFSQRYFSHTEGHIFFLQSRCC